MDPAALRSLIKQVLTPIGLYTADAEELLMATCAQESLLGKYRTQGGGGPARGIFQMEAGDFNDIVNNYLVHKPDLYQALQSVSTHAFPTVDDLVNNDPLAIFMCRVHYLRVPHPLPSGSDLTAMWHYYKVFYNSVLGAATEDQFFAHYKLTGGSAQ